MVQGEHDAEEMSKTEGNYTSTVPEGLNQGNEQLTVTLI